MADAFAGDLFALFGGERGGGFGHSGFEVGDGVGELAQLLDQFGVVVAVVLFCGFLQQRVGVDAESVADAFDVGDGEG